MYNYWEKHNKQLEQLDQKKRDIILQADNAWEAYESERDPQQKPTLKTIWQQLLSEEDDIIDEHCRIRREWQMLEGGGVHTPLLANNCSVSTTINSVNVLQCVDACLSPFVASAA